MNFFHPPSGLCYKRNDLKELPRDCPRIQLRRLGCQNVGAAGVYWKRLPQRRCLYIGPAQSADWAMLEAGHERRDGINTLLESTVPTKGNGSGAGTRPRLFSELCNAEGSLESRSVFSFSLLLGSHLQSLPLSLPVATSLPSVKIICSSVLRCTKNSLHTSPYTSCRPSSLIPHHTSWK